MAYYGMSESAIEKVRAKKVMREARRQLILLTCRSIGVHAFEKDVVLSGAR